MKPLHILVTIATLMVGIPMQTGPVPLSPELTWDRIIAAKGGRERLRSVHTLAWSSDDPRWTSRAFGSVRYELVESYPDRCWAWEDYRPGSMGFAVEVWNAQKRLNWDSRNGGPAAVIPWRADAANFRLRRGREHQLLFLLESADLKPVPRQAISSSTGIVVDLEVPGFVSVTLTVDRATLLPKSLALVADLGSTVPPPKGPDVEYTIEAYTDVDGLQMPTKIAGLGDLRFIINPAVDPQLFETPPSGTVQRDAWRQFLIKR